MLKRCTNAAHTHYKDYGGRGIAVCERWQNFQAFLDDMGERPSGSTLERKDNNRGYEPDNCKWASRSEQARNRSTTKLNEDLVRCTKVAIERGVSLSDLARGLGVSLTTLSYIKRGKRWKDV